MARKKKTQENATSKQQRSRESAKDCRARKNMRFQHLKDMVLLLESFVFVLRRELELGKKWCLQIDNGHIPQEAVDFIEKMKQEGVLRTEEYTTQSTTCEETSNITDSTTNDVNTEQPSHAPLHFSRTADDLVACSSKDLLEDATCMPVDAIHATSDSVLSDETYNVCYRSSPCSSVTAVESLTSATAYQSIAPLSFHTEQSSPSLDVSLFTDNALDFILDDLW